MENLNESGKIYFFKTSQSETPSEAFGPLLEVNSNFDILKSLNIYGAKALGITSNNELLEWEFDSKQQNQPLQAIIDLPKLAGKYEIQNSEIILAIFEICTFNKKYNYECSNNTRAFWERVVEEEVLKKIFKNFKSETLRKYWKIIRLSGNNDKFIEIVRHNEKFINNPVFKLLPIINGISSFIQSNSDQKNFEDYFTSINSKEKKPVVHKEENTVPEKKKNIKMKKVIED